MTLEGLGALVQFMRASGVRSYKGPWSGDPVEVELGAAPVVAALAADPVQEDPAIAGYRRLQDALKPFEDALG